MRGFRLISTPDAQFFESEKNFDYTESFSDVTRFAQRTLADCTQFFCERKFCGMPRFRKFCILFAKLLRKFRVISMLDAHFFGCEQTSNFRKSGSDVVRIGATNDRRENAIFLAQGALKLRKFCNSFSGF